jgi:phosphocarrier protein HPr
VSPSSERTVTLPADLHARPAGAFSRTAAGFDAKVTIAANGKEVDARSVLLVMSLGATKDSEIIVRAEGAEAERAVEALADMLAAATA